jgi:hypothetical protein
MAIEYYSSLKLRYMALEEHPYPSTPVEEAPSPSLTSSPRPLAKVIPFNNKSKKV